MVELMQERRITSINLPLDLWLEVRALLYDPKLKRMKWRSLSPLVTRLLREWVEQQRKE